MEGGTKAKQDTWKKRCLYVIIDDIIEGFDFSNVINHKFLYFFDPYIFIQKLWRVVVTCVAIHASYVFFDLEFLSGYQLVRSNS